MICAASDMHGQWDKYQELVKRLALNDGENELYLLGDLIDRGPGSCKILLDIRKRDNIQSRIHGCDVSELGLERDNQRQHRRPDGASDGDAG